MLDFKSESILVDTKGYVIRAHANEEDDGAADGAASDSAWSASNSSSSLPLLSALPPLMQEAVLGEDLLNVLVGVDGCFVRLLALQPPRVALDASGDRSARELASRVAALGAYYVLVRRAAAHFGAAARGGGRGGLVSQAFGAALHDLCNDYLSVIVELENQQRNGTLSLQQMWFYLQVIFFFKLEKTKTK